MDWKQILPRILLVGYHGYQSDVCYHSNTLSQLTFASSALSQFRYLNKCDIIKNSELCDKNGPGPSAVENMFSHNNLLFVGTHILTVGLIPALSQSDKPRVVSVVLCYKQPD